MLPYIQSIIAIILGIVSSITDLKNKKIYNKNILIALGISAISYAVCFKQIEINYIPNFIINLAITIVISFTFYYFKIWAAGDAKLFLAITFMIQYEIYEVETTNVFPALNLLIIIFCVAFIYVFLETIFLWIKDKQRLERLKPSSFDKEDIKEFVIQYLLGYFIIIFINNILNKFFIDFRISNQGLILLCNMLVLIFVYRIIKTKKTSMIVAGSFLVANIIYYLIFGFQMYAINLKMLLLVFIIILFRRVSEKYNYEEIKISDLKPRMILSYGSVLRFYSSRVKGLPQNTTETTDSRLTEEQVESIKRWSKTSKGTETIVIVKHMPFAPFMFVGEILFFILRLYS